MDNKHKIQLEGKAGAPKGNENAIKFKTPFQRQELCLKYCNHIKQGFSDESFPECDMQTLKKYRSLFAIDFDTDLIEAAQRERLLLWEKIGINGTVGIPYVQNGKEYNRFNAQSWQFNMQNRFKWKIREDMTSDDKQLKPPQVILDTKP